MLGVRHGGLEQLEPRLRGAARRETRGWREPPRRPCPGRAADEARLAGGTRGRTWPGRQTSARPARPWAPRTDRHDANACGARTAWRRRRQPRPARSLLGLGRPCASSLSGFFAAAAAAVAALSAASSASAAAATAGARWLPFAASASTAAAVAAAAASSARSCLFTGSSYVPSACGVSSTASSGTFSLTWSLGFSLSESSHLALGVMAAVGPGSARTRRTRDPPSTPR